MARIARAHRSVSPGGAPYWRIYVTAVDGGAAVAIAEIKMRVVPSSGANVATGGTATADNYYTFDPTYGPDKAFDGSNATIWATDNGFPRWIAYQLPAALTVNEILITSRPDGGTFGQTPATFKIQSSASGSAWTDEWSVTGSTGWAATETRTFTRP